MRPYHPANLKHQPFPAWRVIALAWAGKLLGIQFKIDGIPYGAEYDKALWRRHEDSRWGIGPDDASGAASRVDREGNCIKPERRIVLRARTAGWNDLRMASKNGRDHGVYTTSRLKSRQFEVAMPERGRATEKLDAMAEAAASDFLRRSSISFLECAINLMASHMTLEEVAAILQAEAADLLELG